MTSDDQKQLILKYDRPGPRYTSYPPVPFWTGAPDTTTWIKHITQNSADGIDIYIHIPYCQKLCWYCGCNRVITKDLNKADIYIEALLQEWAFYKKNIRDLKVNSIHFGGGTPNFLKPELLEKLLSELSKNFNQDFFGSVEIDPRTVLIEQLKVWMKYGFKRLSMGIQDFDSDVQVAINRIQPLELVESVTQKMRDLEFNSINFDLIFGLPKQTPKTITDTINQVIHLSPDMIAFYSYAHLPEKITNQKNIKDDQLPTGEAKRLLYETGKALLLKNGYIEIGMDHFAKLGSYLEVAHSKGELLRNFMGYTDKKSKVLLGLGATSISASSLSFAQNEKDPNDYIDSVMKNGHAIKEGHVHSQDDLIVENIIQSIMCNDQADFKAITTRPDFELIKKDLQDLGNDGIIELALERQYLKIPYKHRMFLRNVSMVFDHHLRSSMTKRFSRTI